MQNNTSTLSLFFRRVAAFLYDCLLLIAIFFIITAGALALTDGQAIEHWSYKVFLFFIAFIFFDWFWRHGGQTLGMRAWRIQITSSDGTSISFKQTFGRYISGSLLFGITLVFMFGNARSQALHDKLSNTTISINNK